MKVRAIKEVWYAGRTRKPGDEFDCDDAAACLIWSAPDLPGGPTVAVVAEVPKPVVETRVVEPTPEPVVEVASDPPEVDSTRKRYYRRRDMKAEGDK